MNDLPPGWAWAEVIDIAKLIRGVTFKKQDAVQKGEPGYVPIARAGNLEPGRTKFDDNLIFVSRNLVKKDQFLRAGDVLIATSSGSLSVVGKSAIVSKNWEGGHGAFMAVIRALPDINIAYLGYYLQSRVVRKKWQELAAGTNINNLKKNDLLSTVVPIAPLAEQERIVERIEEIFSRLDAIETSLKSLSDRLGLLRSAILADAFHTNRDLPPGWKRSALEKIVTPRKGKVISDYDDLRPYLSLNNIQSNTCNILNWEHSSDYRSQSSRLFPGDVAYARLRPYLNKVVNIDRESLGSAELIVLPRSESLLPRFLTLLLSNQSFVEYATANSTGDRPRLKWQTMKQYKFDLPPIEHQSHIVELIESNFSLIHVIEESINHGLDRIADLRQSVLAEAFSGRLVPQDPDDEPASVLLERIAASRPAKPKSRRKARS
ncbi:MAG: hypothetical protein F4X21_09330 [Acidimicrobiia bacterium]|nr:hypothetical protein [Acidimicrobiia bacterium]